MASTFLRKRPRRLACDSAKVVMKHASDGTVLDVGRRTRTVPPALRRALAHRDGGCRFPGCGLKLCDAHHVEHWAMTRLVQEAVDHYLAPYGGVDGLIARGIAERGDAGEKAAAGRRPLTGDRPGFRRRVLVAGRRRSGSEIGGGGDPRTAGATRRRRERTGARMPGGTRVEGLVRRLARRSIRVDGAESLPSWEGGPTDYNCALQHLRGLEAAAG